MNHKPLLLLTLLFCVFFQSVKAQKIVSVSVNAQDFKKYCEVLEKDITSTIRISVYNKKLLAYTSADLIKKFDIEDYEKLGTLTFLSDKVEDNEFYMYKDTFIILNTDFHKAKGFVIDKARNLFTHSFYDGSFAFYKLDDIKKVLSHEQNAFLTYCLSKFHDTINQISASSKSTTWFNYFAQQLYSLGVKHTIFPYKNILLTDTFSISEAKRQGDNELVKQYQNPSNPNDIYDIYDSTIIIPFSPDSISNVNTYFSVSNTGMKEFTTKFIAIASQYPLYINGVFFGQYDLFVLKSADWQKHIDAKLFNFLQFFFANSIHIQPCKEIRDDKLFYLKNDD